MKSNKIKQIKVKLDKQFKNEYLRDLIEILNY